MSSTVPKHVPKWARWSHLLNWSPFKIDALGLVTLLGTEEVNACVGRLVRSTYLEYLPLLGAYVIAGDRFLEKHAGFNLYNISQAIHTTDLAPWFSRWMISQNFEQTRSFVVWKVVPRKSFWKEDLISFSISFCLLGMLVALAILSYDFYGFANALAMIFSIVVRWYVINANRQCIDDYVTNAEDEANVHYEENLQKYQESDEKVNLEEKIKLYPKVLYGHHGKQAKVLIIMSDSKAVTMMIPEFLLKPPSVFISDLPKRHAHIYLLMRLIGWLAFAVHIVAIGMADLISQTGSIVLLVTSTILLYARLGCDDSKWTYNAKKLIRMLFRTKKVPDAAMRESDTNFVVKTKCHIGSRLLAEVYEWPLSYEFVTKDDGTLIHDKVFDKTSSRSEKRQHLYSWLQLTSDEEESVDKWDLTPHKRAINEMWMIHYREQQTRIAKMGGGPYYFQEEIHIDPPEVPTPSSMSLSMQRAVEVTRALTTASLVADGTIPEESTTRRNFAEPEGTGPSTQARRRSSTMPALIQSSRNDREQGFSTRENSAYWLTSNTASLPQVTTTEDTPSRRLSHFR